MSTVETEAPALDLSNVPPDVTPMLDRAAPCTGADMLATGATYRQINHWTTRGYFTPPGGSREDADTPGSGYQRKWTCREWMIAHLMVRLIGSGFTPPAAARIARDAVDSHVNRVTTEYGITIGWKGTL